MLGRDSGNGRGKNERERGLSYLRNGLPIHKHALDGWDVEVFCHFDGLGDLSVSGGGVVGDFDEAGGAGGEEEGVEKGCDEAGG